MTPDLARRFLAWVDARKQRVAAMLARLFPVQRKAAEDGARLKAFFCTRRAGKSWAIGVLLFSVALMFPGSSCLYLGLTKQTARAIMNKDVMRVLNRDYEIGAVWNETQFAWMLPNGSVIYFRGADANAYEMGKIVGQKYRLAVLDEASKYKQDLRAIVYGALIPAMGDDLGTVILSGTPSNITAGLFYDVTTGAESGWSVHRWTWRDNVYKLANIQRMHDDLVAANPAIVVTPIYKQEWCGLWIVDKDALVYKYREDLNLAEELPLPAHEYMYGLGVDFGYTDPTALVVVAYHENDPDLYIPYAKAKRKQTVDDVAADIRALWFCPSMKCRGQYPFAFMVGDGASLQVIETLAQRFHLPIECAEKQGKEGVIRVFNSDLMTARIKVLPAAMEITEEWGALIWDEKERAKIPPKFVEDARFPNHLSDGGLYAWRKARNYDALPADPKPPAPFTPEWEAARLERQIAQAKRVHDAGGVFVDELPPWLGGNEEP